MPSTESPPLSRLNDLLACEGVAWGALALSFLVTLGLWRYSEADFAKRANDRFHYRAEQEKQVLLDRMQDYELVLRGAAGLFSASDAVSRGEWRAYLKPLMLEISRPGILGTGFAEMVPAEQRAAHEQAMQREGFADYRITPDGERPLYSSIVYIEPFSGRNARALGYDMFAEPVRREAMERARDSGLPALSGKVTLVQETDHAAQPGFLVYLPVYRSRMPVSNVAERRQALFGFVYSPFRAHDLMNEVFKDPGREVEIELFDARPTPGSLLFSSEDRARQARHVTEIPLEIGGHLWTARFHSSLRFEENTASAQPQMILLGGLGLDLMFFAVLYTNARHRRKMSEAALKLEESRDSFRTLVENVPGTVFRVSLKSPWSVTHLSHGIEALTGEPCERYLSGELSYVLLIHPEDRASVRESLAKAVAERTAYSVEYRINTADGQTRWVSERGCVSYDKEGQAQWLDGVILDITDRKLAEAAIRDLAFYDPLTKLPNRRLLFDRLEQQLLASSRSGRFGALLFIDMDNFKAINDSLGHQVGDQLLIEVAQRLRAAVREKDSVARLGGDEFVILLEDLGDDSCEASRAAGQVSQKILNLLNQTYRLSGYLCASTPSIGVTVFCGHVERCNELIRQADQAMYRAKAGGRNQVCFFEEA